jgi:hypothetical protein
MSHLKKSLFKTARITVSHFFSTLQSTLKYVYSVELVRMHFPAKQPCTNDTVTTVAENDSSDRPKLEDTTNPTTHGDWRLYVQN